MARVACADGGLDVLPGVVVQLGEVAALRLEDLGELADVELGGVGAGGRAGPEPVAAADGLVRRQAAGDGPGDAQAGRVPDRQPARPASSIPNSTGSTATGSPAAAAPPSSGASSANTSPSRAASSG